MADVEIDGKPASDAVIEAKTAWTGLVTSAQKGWQDGRLLGVASIVTGLIVWQIVSDYVIANRLFLASPTQVAFEFVDLVRSGDLWPHLRTSAAEFVLGYSIACVLGIAVGL